MDKFVIRITKSKTQLDSNSDPDDPAHVAEKESSPLTKRLKLDEKDSELQELVEIKDNTEDVPKTKMLACSSRLIDAEKNNATNIFESNEDDVGNFIETYFKIPDDKKYEVVKNHGNH